MCGIAGRVTAGFPVDRRSFETALDSLRHRGPDARAIVTADPACLLGHCRLAVIDTSEAANQPFADPTGRHLLVYNGEVYNFPELRRRLEGLGRAFRTRSDTEVVLHALLEWGVDALPLFNGMFALALFDRESRRLLLARDRFGKKPLYYRQGARHLSFASELSALADDPDRPGTLPAPSLAGLNHFLALGYILHPTTILEGVLKLPPASYAIWERGALSPPRPYWDYLRCYDASFAGTEEDAVDELGRRLEEAVARRLASDVPLGVFLSGGMDSTAVSLFAARRAGRAVDTFCLGFDNPSYDESPDARRVARHLGTRHHEFRFDPTADDPTRVIAAWDEPFSDTSLLPTRSLCRQTRAHVTVALSGDGSDELLAGYPTYRASAIVEASQRIPAPLRRACGALLARLPVPHGRKTPLAFKLRRFGRGFGEPLARAHYAWRLMNTLEERIALLGPEHADALHESDPAQRFDELFRRAADLPPLHRCLYADGMTWLTDDILVKTDRASMAHGLEVRCPFLDPAVVSLAASLPPAWKRRGGRGKLPLARLLARQLPGELLEKRKAGFNAPVADLLGPEGGAGVRSDVDEFVYFNRYVFGRHPLAAQGAVASREGARA